MSKFWICVAALAGALACTGGGSGGGDGAVGDGGLGDGGGGAGGGADAAPACEPVDEQCNGADDDCDGSIDEGFDGLGMPCEIDGCATPGRRVCGADGASVICAVTGVPEACDAADNDCDGVVDEDVSNRCYPGPEGTDGVGACAAGVLACVDGVFGECDGAILPTDEVCNAVDDDCDGVTDEGEMLCPVCGDGVVHPDEDCDDGNQADGDGCDSMCTFEPAANGVVLLCGDSARDVAAWLRPADRVAVAAGCVPGDDTRALLVTEAGLESIDDAALRRYLALGGNVVTSTGVSRRIFARVYQTEIELGVRRGECGGRVHPELRAHPDDRVWQAFGDAEGDGPAACGDSLDGLVGITPLGGWDAMTSLAYRHFGQGRLWLVEADWPAEGAPLDADSARLMRLMMLWRAGARAPGVQQNMPIELIEARGFRRCFTGGYEGRDALADLVRGCGGDDLLIGCRPRGATTLRVAAEGQLAQVMHDVGTGVRASHLHNGVQFYFNAGWSWGFAPGGAEVLRNNCDVADRSDPLRMCWHTAEGALFPGYSCGGAEDNVGDFERVVYARGSGAELGADRGFGHHGGCEAAWNGCIDAATCAQAACTYAGQGDVLAWEASTCVTEQARDPAFTCDVFDGLPDNLDEDWDPARCDVNVAYDVQCAAPRRLELGAARGFGAPGDCAGFSGCVDAADCAARACGADVPVAWSTGRCAELQAHDPGFVCRMIGEDGADLGPAPAGCDLAVVYDVACEPTPPVLPATFSGIRNDVAIADVEAIGFEECWSDTYGEEGATLAQIDRQCSRGELLMGCTTGDPTVLKVAAMGPRDVITTNTDDAIVTRTANEVQWYRDPNRSWGFAPINQPVALNTCDTEGRNDEDRVCWHVNAAALQPGFRCGSGWFLDEAQRRVIFHRAPR